MSNFRFRWSKVKVTGPQKRVENGAYLVCKHGVHKHVLTYFNVNADDIRKCKSGLLVEAHNN